MKSPKQMIDEVVRGTHPTRVLTVLEAETRYEVNLVRSGDVDSGDWRAELSIPSAHVDLVAAGKSGWDALLRLANKMKNMGLLD